jgi:hypothetical protein
MRQCKRRSHVVAMTDKLNAPCKVRTRDEFLKLAPVTVPTLRVSGQNENGVAEPALVTQSPNRLDHQDLTLPTCQSSGL